MVIPALWYLPPLGWIKVNTDDSSIGAQWVVGCGGIFCSSRGFVRGFFVIPLGQAYVFKVELDVALYAFEKAQQFSWDKIWLECDFSFV